MSESTAQQETPINNSSSNQSDPIDPFLNNNNNNYRGPQRPQHRNYPSRNYNQNRHQNFNNRNKNYFNYQQNNNNNNYNYNNQNNSQNFYQNEVPYPNQQFQRNPSQNQNRKYNQNNQNIPQQRPSTSNTNSQETSNKPKQQNKPKPKSAPTPSKVNQSRAEILSEQLKKNKCECMVCYASIRHDKPIWNCNVCFHIFHLSCIKKWANSPAAKIEENTDKWRCPGCQTIFNSVPNNYTCFCTKKLNPEHENRPFYQLKQLPHSCGEVCGKALSDSAKFYQQLQSSIELSNNLECKHKCVDICHPGPCLPCESLVTRSCNCGKSKFQVKCSSSKVPACEKRCDKMLNCKLHICERVCHAGECEPCSIDIELSCFSHTQSKTVNCGSEEFNSSHNSLFSCDQICDKTLTCQKHKCTEKCHPGECKPCALMPSKLTNCPCGQTQIRELLIQKKIIRTSCTDPVPTCDKICSKILPCTLDSENVHLCESKCHTDECPACEKLIEKKCRCGKETEMIKCSDRNAIKLCDRRCQKKKTCSRHQCNELCCDDKDHICMQICNKLLGCGLHKCEELCHKGSCKRCLVASFLRREFVSAVKQFNIRRSDVVLNR